MKAGDVLTVAVIGAAFGVVIGYVVKMLEQRGCSCSSASSRFVPAGSFTT